MAEPSRKLAQAHRTPHALRMPVETPLASDADNACCVRDVICNEAVPFRSYCACAGVVTRTRNVSEYMLVLALCLANMSSQFTLDLLID